MSARGDESGQSEPTRRAAQPARVAPASAASWLQALSDPAQRGYRHLIESTYLPADLDDEVFAALVEATDAASPPLPDAGGAVGLNDKRGVAFLKYGLTERPGDGSGKPLQYVVDSSQRWTMNCFACHVGSVYGKHFPGAPNNLYQLQSLVEDVRATKLRLGKPLTHMDVGSIFMPLGSTVGTTNAVMFGVALMNYRDADLNVQPLRGAPHMVHHDMDAPAWWLFHRKTRLYADGFAEKGARGLMQFMLVRENGPDKFRAWESDFEDVYAFLESVPAPAYQGPIDRALADRGRAAFNTHCVRCHGAPSDPAYPGARPYPEKLIPIEEIGTDRARLDALTPAHRQRYGQSWFAHLGEQETWDDPGGYMAPPLDSIWASAPYFHNGSVPTLWHVLHPDQRPTVWRRTHLAMDQERMGLQVTELDALPANLTTRQRREYFDSRAFGKSNAGHEFPNQLTEAERAAVLEYLKTL
jgi:mono/diheme cytochrome c family protein